MRSEVKRILAAKGLRAFGDGYVALLLPAYLLELGFGPLAVGIIATATLLGSGLLTLLVGLHAHRYRQRSLLLAATVLMAGTGIGFAWATGFWPLLLIAIVGTLNPSSGDVSVFLPLEHAALAHLVKDDRRTAVFARYSLVGALLSALGALAAGLPVWFAHLANVPLASAIQAMFVLYAVLAGLAALAYRGLPRSPGGEERSRSAPLTTAKRNVYALAALFSLDAFAGGFVVQSMLALWLYQRVRPLPGRCRQPVLLDGSPDRALLSRRGAHRQSLRIGQHDGVHPSALESVFDRHSVHAGAQLRDRAAVRPERVVADGRSHAQFLRHGHRAPGRATRPPPALRPCHEALPPPRVPSWPVPCSLRRRSDGRC